MTYFLRFLCLSFALCVAGAGFTGLTADPAWSQTAAEDVPDYEAWQKTAARADEAIEAARASTAALEQLRAELASWRQQFQAAQSVNSNAIETVRRQLDALGPVPESGEELADIATQRQQLNERLERLREPVLAAELAYSRADGLIQGIDRIIRNRQNEEILRFGPSPLNPTHWTGAVSALWTSIGHVRSEFLAAWANPIQQTESKRSLPVALVFALVGLVLVVRGRAWSRRFTARILQGDPGPARWIGGFVVSLGSLVLPFIGVFALTEAIYTTGLVGLRSDQKLVALLPAVFTYLVARWLATRVFPADEARTLPLHLDQTQRARGRFYGATLGMAAGLVYFLQELSSISGWAQSATVVILFPLIVLCSFLLWRLAALLRAHVRNDAEDDGQETYRSRMISFLALALLGLAVLAPLLAAVGYFKLSEALLFPSLASLELLAALLVLQRLVVEVYVLITGNREGATESLVPILIGFMLVLASVPFFALAWGARIADLTELWTTITEGVTVGDVRISPAIFMTFAIVFVLGFLATRLVQGALKNTILPKTRLDPGGRNAIVSGVGYLGIFLAAVIAITSAGIDLSSIAIVAGALSVGIGFGLQNIVSNFVSGIILLIERPITEGDWIEVGGVHGTVRQISVRSTVIETFDRSDVIVPNSDFVSGRVTNYTRGNTVGRVIVPVGVAYGTDTRRVEKILLDIAQAHPMVLANPAPYINFAGFGADSLDFEIRAILRDVNWVLSVKSEMNHQIAAKFAEEEIEIPFAQRDVWLRNPEALVAGGASGEAIQAGSGEEHITAQDLDLDDGQASRDGDAGGDGDGR